MTELRAMGENDRKLVRAALKKYKSDHDIGDPELLKTMWRELKADDRELQLPTLQRFLRGKHRTHDGTVRRYMEFVNKAAPPPPYEALAMAINTLYETRGESVSERADRCQEIALRLPRVYQCYVRGTPARSPIGGKTAVSFPDLPSLRDEETGSDLIPFAVLAFNAVPGVPYLRVRERVYNPWRFLYADDSFVESLARKGGCETYEGAAVIVPSALTLAISLRSITYDASLPRQYTLSLHRGLGQPLRGMCVWTNASQLYAQEHRYIESAEVRLYPAS